MEPSGRPFGRCSRDRCASSAVASRLRFGLAMLAGLLPLAPACSSNGNPSDTGADDGGVTEDQSDEGRPDEVEDAGDAPDDDVGPDVGGDADALTETDLPDARDSDDVADESPGEDADGDVPEASILPTGCRFARPTTDVALGWLARYSIDSGVFVWRWVDASVSPSQGVLMARELATGIDREVVRTTWPWTMAAPAVHGGQAFYSGHDGATDPVTDEVYGVDLVTGTVTKITGNTSEDGFAFGGEEFVVFEAWSDPPGPGSTYEWRYVDRRDGSEHRIADKEAEAEIAFDGHRWVAYTLDNLLYKLDLSTASPVAQLVYDDTLSVTGMAFDRDTGVLIVAAARFGESDDFRLEAWDLATDTMTVVLDEPWSQVMGDVDGLVVLYEDSQPAGEPYWPRQHSALRILDRETGVKREVMPLDTYYGEGIWERWIAFNNYGLYGDSLITCDLVEAGYMDAEGHVIPE